MVIIFNIKYLNRCSGPDGSVFIGDYNMVRRIYPDGRVSTILVFPKTQVL